MRHAIVAIEDRRFWEHDGVDLRGIGRALIADIRHKAVVEGGSTITQQFVKNALDRDQKTIARKVREAAYAWQLERDPGGWPKKKILQEYLNTIYFGNGAYGVQQPLVEDPAGVPEHDLLRQRRLRCPAGGAHLLPARRQGPDAARGGAARRDSRRSDPVRPGHQPERGSEAAATRPPRDVRGVADHRAAAPAGECRPAARPRQGPAARHRRTGPALRQLRQAAADRRVRADEGVRGRPPCPDDDRPRAAADGPRRDLEVADQARRPLGRARRDRPTRRRRPRHDRRQQLPQEPVQPGGAGRPPAGLVVQALRARDRAAPGHLAGDALRVGAAVDRPRRQGLGRRQLRRHLLREHRPGEGDDRVGQLRLRAADAAGRIEEGRRDGEAARDPEQARRVLRDRARRGGGDAARARPVVRDLRPRRPARGRGDLRQQAAGDHGGDGGRAEAAQHAEGVQRADGDSGRRRQLDPAEGRALRHRQARLHPGPADGRQDRHDGELRRRLVRRLHAAARGGGLGRVPDDAEADADGVPRRCRHGRQLPRPDLEVVHGEGAQERAARRLPGAGRPVRGAEARRPPRRPADARQRSLQARARRSSTSPGPARPRPRTASRTRSRCPTCAS